MLGLISFGYFCGGIATTLLASGSWRGLPSFYRNAASISSDSNVSEIYMELAKHISMSIILATCVVVSVS